MESLERKLRYSFHDRELLSEALNHSSYANEHRSGLSSNERLEFLGDSVLGFVAAEFLFKRSASPPTPRSAGTIRQPCRRWSSAGADRC